jgi:hypothetical protein
MITPTEEVPMAVEISKEAQDVLEHTGCYSTYHVVQMIDRWERDEFADVKITRVRVLDDQDMVRLVIEDRELGNRYTITIEYDGALD